MPQIADHFRILGLDFRESITQLSAAYRRAMLEWHPDRFHCDSAMQKTATKRAAEINAAFEHLSELFENGTLPRSTVRANSAPNSNSQNACRTQHTYDRRPFTPGFLNPNVVEVFVKSSAIISTGYDRTKETLYIKFNNGSICAYLHVPESVFSAFLAAESYGTFLHCHILWQYKYESVRC